MVCSNCGTSVTSNYKFCPRCGTPINNYSVYQQYNAYQGTIQQNQSYLQNNNQYPDHNNSRKKIISLQEICETEKTMLKNTIPIYAFVGFLDLATMIICAFVAPPISFVCVLFLVFLFYSPIMFFLDSYLFKKGDYSVAVVECTRVSKDPEDGRYSFSFNHPNNPRKTCWVKDAWIIAPFMTPSVGDKIYIIFFENKTLCKIPLLKTRFRFIGEFSNDLSPELQAKLKIIDKRD